MRPSICDAARSARSFYDFSSGSTRQSANCWRNRNRRAFLLKMCPNRLSALIAVVLICYTVADLSRTGLCQEAFARSTPSLTDPLTNPSSGEDHCCSHCFCCSALLPASTGLTMETLHCISADVEPAAPAYFHIWSPSVYHPPKLAPISNIWPL